MPVFNSVSWKEIYLKLFSLARLENFFFFSFKSLQHFPFPIIYSVYAWKHLCQTGS